MPDNDTINFDDVDACMTADYIGMLARRTSVRFWVAVVIISLPLIIYTAFNNGNDAILAVAGIQ